MKKGTSLLSAICILGLGVGLLSACQEIPAVYLGQEAVHEHSWNEGVVTKEATCTEEGEMTYTCECGETYTAAIPATGHSWGEWSADVVDGEDQGTHTRVCSACQTTETDVHQWGNWASVSDSEGSHYEKVCDICGAVATASSVSDIIDDLGEGETLSIEVDNVTDLNAALVDGATIVLTPELEEGASEEDVPAVKLDETLTVGEGVSATVVVSEGTALAGSSSHATTGSALVSVGNGGTLNLVLGDGATVSGNATSTTGSDQGHGGLVTVADGGTLIIDGDGDVTQEHSASAVLTVAQGGTCIINGGRYSVTGSTNYSVINDGTLIINDGTFVTTNSGSSLIINGDDNTGGSHVVVEHEAPTLTITGGEFLGGKHVIKNCLDGVLTIDDGYFDGFLPEYYDDNGEVQSVGETTDIIDNEEATTIINGGHFGESLEATEGETGNFKRIITVKGGSTDSDTDYPSIVTINGGSFSAGSEASEDSESTTLGLFDFGDSSKSETASTLDQLHIATAVYNELFPTGLAGSEAFKVSDTISAAGYVVLIGSSVTEVADS